jgi:hypothetical protein
MTPLGRTLLNELPGWAQNEPLYKAAANIWSRESERMLAKAQEVRDAAIPSLEVPLLLEVWEASLHLPRKPAGLTEPERWASVLARIRRAIEDPSGLSWVKRVTEQIGSGWSYVEEAPNIINVTVPYPPGSEAFLFGERVLLEEIPAAWELVYGSTEGFLLDVSKLDEEPLDA